jgi:hypothetical protein
MEEIQTSLFEIYYKDRVIKAVLKAPYEDHKMYPGIR